jgi:ankyrin repeat protein
MGGFKPNQLVRLQGLSNAAYNGKLAIVSSAVSDDGRHTVELQDDDDVVDPPVHNRGLRIKPEHLAHACNHCHKTDAAKLQFCAQCRMAGYCNAECQRNDWQRHKVDCKNLSITREILKSPLYIAACNGELTEVQNLVEQGADVNKENSDGSSSLFIAVQQGFLEVVQYLVQQGAEKDKATIFGCTAVYLAAQQGHLEVVQYLAQQGVDKDKARDNGSTALNVAAEKGHLAVVQYLVQQGADKENANIDGVTPLYIAARNGHLDVLQYLVQQGADKNKARDNGITPVYVAAQKGNLAVVQYLVQQGADKNKPTNNNGATPLCVAIDAAQQQAVPAAQQ